uniref:Putative secreted protein n=1 Tax=Ixodes ricinus TaxID=34613 RepID=A0A6B0UZ86_IXORI
MMQSDSFSSWNFIFILVFFFCSSLSASRLTVSKTVSAISCCHRSEITTGKFLYSSWSASVSLIPLVSSSSKEPMSKASAAFTSPLGGIRGGGYFCRYTSCQSMPPKNEWLFTSSAPCPRQPSRLSTSRCSSPSRSSFSSAEKLSGSSTFMVKVIRSISCLSFVLCCRNGLCPLSSL